MPVYRVRVEERHIETVEEVHHAYRDVYYESVYEVEAENMEEAQLNYEQGDRISREFMDSGDYYDSDYYETGDVLNSEWEDEEILDCENTETGEVEPPPRPARPTQFTAQWARIYSTAGNSGTYYTPQPQEPNWEV